MEDPVRFLVKFDEESDKEILNEKLYEEGIDYEFDENERYIVDEFDSNDFVEIVEELGFDYEMI